MTNYWITGEKKEKNIDKKMAAASWKVRSAPRSGQKKKSSQIIS